MPDTNNSTSGRSFARIKGSPEYPQINGIVQFRQTDNGVLVTANIYGLPHNDSPCESPIFGFHIHEGTSCTGNEDDPFADAKSHYNPNNCPHPHHAGDLPPLFGNSGGYAFLSFLTDRFALNDVIGKTIIIHSNPDDFTTQPSGNSGKKIACGIIRKL